MIEDHPAPFTSAILIRPYLPEDSPALARICIETSQFPQFLKSLTPEYTLYPFLHLEPESCLVAEQEGRVIGYWIGTIDLERFARRFAPYILFRRTPTLIRMLPRAWAGLRWRERLRFLVWSLPRLAFCYQLIRPTARDILRQVGHVFGRVEVHFQLDRAAAPATAVFQLGDAWFAYARSRGVRGTVMCGIPGGSNDPRALRLWGRFGYVPVSVPLGPSGQMTTWLVAPLSDPPIKK